MQTLRVDLILAAAMGAVFLIALRGGKVQLIPKREFQEMAHMGPARFFALFWGWADYRPKDWSRAAYKRGYTS